MPNYYPAGPDLEVYLFAPGVVPADDPAAPNPSPMESLDLVAKAAAAAKAFERATDWIPFLGGAETTRTFDHNGQSGGFDLPSGLLSVSSVYTGVGYGSAGTPRTLGTDFRLLPLNAPQDGLAYTRLQWGAQGYFSPPGGDAAGSSDWGSRFDGGMFDPYFFGQAGQITITGVWGRVLSLDDDDFDAILQYAAFLCVPQVSLMISKGLYSARDLNFELRYAGGKSSPLSTETEMWKANFQAQAALRRRISVI